VVVVFFFFFPNDHSAKLVASIPNNIIVAVVTNCSLEDYDWT